MFFDNYTDEGDLKNEYRRLMIKNHYDSPNRDEEIINVIFNEYIEKLDEIKQSEGYQSPYQKAVAMATEIENKAKARKKECIREIMDNKEEKFSKRFREVYKIWRSPIRLWIKEE